jgi:6-pyruvoyl-tetrahydropterin synthase
MTKKMVWSTLQFVGFHYFKGAKGKEAFLRHIHRHSFHVKVGVCVSGLDREVEFIALKQKVLKFVRENYEDKTFPKSCEMIAQEIIDGCQVDFAEVSEDQECGATIWSDEQNRGGVAPML